MKIQIMSHQALEQRAEKPFPENTAVISIRNPGDTKPVLKNQPEKILHLEFDDITESELKEALDIPDRQKVSEVIKAKALDEFLQKKNIHLFSEQQARETADFIKQNYADTKVLICQCGYGVSRSAGVAAAVAEYYYRKGIDIFAHEKYYPNKLVFKRLLEALKSGEKERVESL